MAAVNKKELNERSCSPIAKPTPKFGNMSPQMSFAKGTCESDKEQQIPNKQPEHRRYNLK